MFPEAKYMQRCLQLATFGQGRVSPNPMVGAVIIHNGNIIGEGYHRQYGHEHAEVNAIQSVPDVSLLPQSTLYVNLEPCSHYGKTPPCAKLIIEKKIPRVIIGMQDPYSQVAGRGIQMLREAGIEVITDFMKKSCEELNKRFITYLQQKRPYIILKWAQSSDGFIDKAREAGDTNDAIQFSSGLTRMIMHQRRTIEDAILIGTHTALLDNPWLTVRHWIGRNPLRVIIDRKSIIPTNHHVFDNSASTFIWKGSRQDNSLDLKLLMDELYRQRIQSLIVEGGTMLLSQFIQSGLWDEANVETAFFPLFSGVKAPVIAGNLKQLKSFKNSIIAVYNNTDIP